jgi:PEP-CTERM motif-containing protein
LRRRADLISAALFLVGLAAPASATVQVDLIGEPGPGDLVTFHTYVTCDGGETSDAIFGAIEYPSALVAPYPAGSSQVSLSTIGAAAPGWSMGALTCTSAFCVAFSQVQPNGPETAGLTNALIATTTFAVVSDAPMRDIMNSFQWRTAPSTQRLDFFGVTSAPAMYITIMPEPSTAALLGLGLLGLALAGRRPA